MPRGGREEDRYQSAKWWSGLRARSCEISSGRLSVVIIVEGCTVCCLVVLLLATTCTGVLPVHPPTHQNREKGVFPVVALLCPCIAKQPKLEADLLRFVCHQSINSPDIDEDTTALLNHTVTCYCHSESNPCPCPFFLGRRLYRHKRHGQIGLLRRRHLRRPSSYRN